MFELTSVFRDINTKNIKIRSTFPLQSLKKIVIEKQNGVNVPNLKKTLGRFKSKKLLQKDLTAIDKIVFLELEPDKNMEMTVE